MKSTLLKFAALAAFAGAVAIPSTFALPTVVLSDGPGAPGGLFNVTTSAHGAFQTFCLEYFEDVSFGGGGFYYSLSTEAMYNNAFPTTDPISTATAWLFANYSTILGYSAASPTDNNLVQEAIWFLENEGSFAGNAYSAAAITATGASAFADANGAYGVYVMNLWVGATGPGPLGAGAAQDLLIIPGVPEGGVTVAFIGLAFAAIAATRRKIVA